MIATQTSIRQARIDAAERALNRAYSELSAAEVRLIEINDDHNQAQRMANRARDKVDAAHEEWREAHKWEPPAVPVSIFKKPLPDVTSERPTVEGSGVQDTGGDPDARTTE